jgi:hypothetical protein
VFAGERETGELMVKEHLALPAINIVAIAAIGPQPLIMGIIAGVTAYTLGWRQFHMRRFLVTCLAQDWLVCPLQWEASHRVVVEFGYFPVFAIMAFSAVRPIAAFVGIVFLVATDAGHRWLFESIVGAVTPGTCCGRMRADQFESRILIVIEIDRFPG